jgi:hypothetical protein
MRSKIFTRTVGYWPLQEDRGQALDYSGNENHASTTDVSSYGASGPLDGSAMEFNGSSSWVKIPDNSVLDVEKFTVSVWFKVLNTPNSGEASNLVFRRDGSDWSQLNYGVYLIEDGSGNWVIKGNYVDSADNQHDTTGSTPVEVDRWHHAVFKYDNSKTELYLNSELEASRSATSSPDTTGDQILGIGNSQYSINKSTNKWHNGKIAHVRIWDYPLPEASIKALYNASKGGFSESDNKTL